MAVCVPFPAGKSPSLMFYATNAILTPIIFGLGIVGNILAILIMNRHFLRKGNAVYVYLTGVATVDILTILSLVPSSLRDMEVFPVNVTYSMPVSYLAWLSYGAENTSNMASSWLLVFVALVAYMSARWPLSPRRFMRISSSRIGVFIIYMVCALVNFPRFFESTSKEVTDHCFTGQKLWNEVATPFGQGELYQQVYPWLSLAVSNILPIFLLIIFLSLLSHYARLKPSVVCKASFTKPKKGSGKALEISRSVFAIITAFIILEIPNVILQTMRVLMGPGLEGNSIFEKFSLIAKCLSLSHCALNFIFLCAFNYDFRYAFSRTCCCLCDCCMDSGPEPTEQDSDLELENGTSKKVKVKKTSEMDYYTKPEANGKVRPHRGDDYTRSGRNNVDYVRTIDGRGDIYDLVPEMKDGWI